jgi:hypothetical protein
MTEVEWQTATSYGEMLLFLNGPNRPGSDRKLLRFALACAEVIRPYIQDERFAQVLAVTERVAEGMASREEIIRAAGLPRKIAIAAKRRYRRLYDAGQPTPEAVRAYFADRVAGAFEYAPWMMVKSASGEVRTFVENVGGSVAEEEARQYRLLRDIFGNPFRPAAVDPRWQTATVVELTRAIHAERAFERLPILADALEEVGCTEPEILDHCRGSGPHVPGCWVIDALRGGG